LEEINIWDLGDKINIKLNEDFLKKINLLIRKNFRSKEKFYNKIKKDCDVPYGTFKNLLKYSYYKCNFYSPLSVFISCCNNLYIPKDELQENILSYKTKRGWNTINKPILPIRISPIFDMILAHHMADGNVASTKGRQLYFGYRQFDKELRLLYIKKLESIFGKIKYKKDYFKKSTKPYCPAVISQLFFRYYNLNKRSFLSKKARIPKEIFNKSRGFLLAVILAFIIDEGNIDSTLIVIRLKNIKLTRDLYKICKRLGYKSTFKTKGDYGSLYIVRNGMKKLFKEYKILVKKYPEASLGKFHDKIESGLEIYNRLIYKTKGNRDIIFKMLKKENLTINQIAHSINMTRQGVRWHIHILEKENKIIKKGLIERRNILYGVGG